MEPLHEALSPWDEHNRRLASHVHPENWENPQPQGPYNLVVIGAGTAGLVAAAGAAGLGARVALVERHLMGGDCLNVGCVPSKTLIRAARAAKDARQGERFGVRTAGAADVDFAVVMERVRKIRAQISPADSAQRFRDLGVDVFIGEGRFENSRTVSVGDRKLTFSKALIATGARAVDPEIDGLSAGGFLTNESVFNLTELPLRLAVIGGGPIGCELAQAFALLGSEVTLLHSKSHILDREDVDAAAIVQQELIRDGVRLVLNAEVQEVRERGGGRVLVYEDGNSKSVEVDSILVGAGRTPNVDGLNLEGVGVDFGRRRGVHVDDFLRTTNPNIFAAGDVCMDWKFTHAADFAARIVLQNALFSVAGFGRRKLSSLTMPWVTYTDPEIAHVGSYDDGRIPVDTWTQSFEHVDRAITDGETNGIVKIHTRKGSDEIVGATIVARHAGEMISEISTAMAGKVGLGKLAGVIHPYPTQAEAIRKCGDQFNRARLTPRVKRLLSKWLGWRR